MNKLTNLTHKKRVVLLLATLSPLPVWADNTPMATPEWFVYTVVGLSIFSIFIGLAVFGGRLVNDKSWSLAAAVSEEIHVTALEIDGENIKYKPDGSQEMLTKLGASSSRLIAFLGTLVILGLFIGFGIFALMEFGKTGKMPSGMGDAIKFLVGGLTLFAPYAVNQFSGIFNSLTSPKL
jgi:hypothetical protein